MKSTMRNFNPHAHRWIALCVNNMYMNGIHNGIQAAHAVVRMVRNHDRDARLQAWADQSQTIWIKKGGMQKSIYDFASQFEQACLKARVPILPYAAFHEEADALNGALTSIAFLIPDPSDLERFPAAYKRFWVILEEIMPRAWAT